MDLSTDVRFWLKTTDLNDITTWAQEHFEKPFCFC